MADDREQQINDQPSQGEESQPQQPGGAEESKSARMDAAKAWMRAMYAGADDVPELEITGQQAEEAAAQRGPCLNCQHLTAQLAEADQRAQEAENGYKRLMADFENFRRRMEKEREEFTSLGVQKAVEALLPALDDMDRAVASLTPEMSPDKIIDSLHIVFNRVARCLEQLGVKAMTVIGEHFDPRHHEPVQEVQSTEFPDGAVIHELRRGYTLNDKVIRPALVNVASNVGGAAEPAGSDESQPAGPAQADAEAQGKEKIYDLSAYEATTDEDEEQLKKKIDEYLETPAAGKPDDR